MKFFNTAGPIKPDIHYCLPPLERMNKEELLSLIAAEKYFVLHAPRQTGKTTCLLALVDELNSSGQYRAVYTNVEAAQASRENISEAMRAILSELAINAKYFLRDEFPDRRRHEILAADSTNALVTLLGEWSQTDARPLVVMIDEIDSLIGDTLIAVLRQLRSGYNRRPAEFPQSVILCGVRDVRDYRIHSSTSNEIITGGSAFNIKAESLRLGNFTEGDIEKLYQQHTLETGQVFEGDILPLVWDLTAGQPWLVNALAHQATHNIKEMRDRTKPITISVINQAKEELILRRDTHLDQLADKLQEPRVRGVIEPMLAGVDLDASANLSNEISYVVDLGLIRRGANGLEISNAIYREIIPRELTAVTQLNFESTQRAAWYIAADGRLDMKKLLEAFQQFFREHSEHWVERFDYKEAGPQLLLQAFLQRIVNGGGRIEREYGLGRKRTDLLVLWNHPAGVQRVVLELKLAHGSLEKTLQTEVAGLAQTAEYMDKCGAREGHLVIFNRSPDKTWEEKIYHRTENTQDYTIEVWGM
ncbi:MAG: ATP-binding protein [Acidobacteriota bacterium]